MAPMQVKVVASALIEHPGGVLLLRRARNFGELDPLDMVDAMRDYLRNWLDPRRSS